MDSTERPKAWVSVPEGGQILAGLSRSASYAAAARGQLPTLRVGRRLVVPLAKLHRLLGIEPVPAPSSD